MAVLKLAGNPVRSLAEARRRPIYLFVANIDRKENNVECATKKNPLKRVNMIPYSETGVLMQAQ